MIDSWDDQIGKHHTFTARFIRVGHVKKQRGKRMLLRDINCIDGTPFRDHLHLPYTKRFRRKELEPGDKLTIRGKVNRYFVKRNKAERAPDPKNLIAQLEITNIKIISIERHSP